MNVPGDDGEFVLFEVPRHEAFDEGAERGRRFGKTQHDPVAGGDGVDGRIEGQGEGSVKGRDDADDPEGFVVQHASLAEQTQKAVASSLRLHPALEVLLHMGAVHQRRANVPEKRSVGIPGAEVALGGRHDLPVVLPDEGFEAPEPIQSGFVGGEGRLAVALLLGLEDPTDVVFSIHRGPFLAVPGGRRRSALAEDAALSLRTRLRGTVHSLRSWRGVAFADRANRVWGMAGSATATVAANWHFGVAILRPGL